MTVPGAVRGTRHELDLDDDGHEDILTSVTTETDTTKRLAPDGTGGVEFVPDSGSAPDASDVSIADAGGYYTGTDVEAALQEIGAALAVASVVYAPVMASAPHIVTTTGDVVYIPLTTTDGQAILGTVPV